MCPHLFYPVYVSVLVIDPKSPTTLYAGTTGGGVFKSTDGGGTWSASNTGQRARHGVNAALACARTHGRAAAPSRPGLSIAAQVVCREGKREYPLYPWPQARGADCGAAACSSSASAACSPSATSSSAARRSGQDRSPTLSRSQ